MRIWLDHFVKVILVALVLALWAVIMSWIIFRLGIANLDPALLFVGTAIIWCKLLPGTKT